VATPLFSFSTPLRYTLSQMGIYKHKMGFILGALCLSGIFSSPLLAIRISYPVNQFTTDGLQASQVMTLTNDTDAPFAALLNAYRRTCNVDGKDILSDPVEDFVIDPRQVLLPPGESLPIHISYIGKKNLDFETAYRIEVTEVKLVNEDQPVTEEKVSGAKIELSFLTRNLKATYVKTPGMTPDVIIANAEAIDGPDGKPGLEIVFHNRGTAHTILQKINLMVTPKTGEATTITLPKAIPYTNILADHKRRFVVPWPEGLPIGPVRVTYSAE